MVDDVDRVAAMDELHLEDAMRARAQRPACVGLTHCEDMECGEPITPQRQAMGARLCIDCATADEARAAHQRKWRR